MPYKDPRDPRNVAQLAAYYQRNKEHIRATKQTPKARAYQRAYRERSKVERGRYMKLYYRAAKQRLKAYLAGHPCIDCGFSDVRCLQFDHVRGIKSFDVSIATLRWELILKEIAKCDVRCANCHKIRHYGGENGPRK